MQQYSEDFIRSEIIARIHYIDFDKKQIGLKVNQGKKSFTVLYQKEQEDQLLEERRDLLRVSCDVKHDIQGEIAEIKNAIILAKVVLSPITINNFMSDGDVVTFREKLIIKTYIDEDSGQVYIAEYPPLDLFVYSENFDELMDEVKEYLSWCWIELVKDQDANLAPSAVKVKTVLESMVMG